MNNETSGKPTPMTYKTTPMGGTDPNSTKPGSGPATGANKYKVDNSYYNLAGAPTLGMPMGGTEGDVVGYKPRALSSAGAPNLRKGSGGRNNET